MSMVIVSMLKWVQLICLGGKEQIISGGYAYLFAFLNLDIQF